MYKLWLYVGRYLNSHIIQDKYLIHSSLRMLHSQTFIWKWQSDVGKHKAQKVQEQTDIIKQPY